MEGFNLQADPNATIKLTSYHPDHMVYEYSASSEQLALFSEIYYPPSKGWNTYLNGEKIAPFTKANYLIRALRLPAGQNQKLEMKFEPKSFVIGDKVSLVASLLILLLFGGGLFTYFKDHNLPNASRLVEEKNTPVKKTAPAAKYKKNEKVKKKPKKK